MALTLGDNFSYQGAKPLDARLKYDTVAAMKAVADSTLYDGCLAYCVATDKTYQWKSTNEIDTTLGRWREFGGSGTVTVDDELSDTSENPVQNKVIKNALDAKVDETVVGDLSDLHTTDKTDLVSAINEAAQAENQVISLADFEQLTPSEKNSGKAYFIQDAYAEDRYIAFTGFTPVGTVISYYGETAPAHYLVCDGSVYNKADYPELWTHLSSLSNTTPYVVDGDNTKFKVPDLRGEFLRGTGTNGHTNQGNGADVGVHQDGTLHKSNFGTGGYLILAEGKPSICDTTTSISAEDYIKGTNRGNIESYNYTSRPTNTSVLYCIAYHNIYIDARHNYSLEEQEVGTWIDGKTLYQKTIDCGTPPANEKKNVAHGVANMEIAVREVGIIQNTTIGTCNPLPAVVDTSSKNLSLGVDRTNIILMARQEDWTGYNKLFVTIQYTKTTD